MSTALVKVAKTNDLEAEDRVAAAANDIIGILQVVRLGGTAYWPLAGAMGLIIASSFSVMVSARVLGKLVTALTAGPGRESELMAAEFMALETLAVAFQYFGRIALAKATTQVVLGIRCQLFAKMQRLPIAYFDGQPLGRTITRLTADVEGVETFFSGTLSRVLIAMINVVGVLAAMLLTDAHFGSVIVACSLPALVFSFVLRKPVMHWLRTYKRRSAHINAKLAEFLAGLPVIKIFGLEAWTERVYNEAADSLLAAGLKNMTWNSIIRPSVVMLCSLPTLLILWMGGEGVLNGTLELGVLVAFVRFSERFVSPIRTLSQEVQNIQEAVVSAERVRRMLLEPEEDEALGPDGSNCSGILGAVEYRDVWMAYQTEPVLRGVSFVATQGMKIGLVGATGSGKTSTVNLVPRLYPFHGGTILLDGRPLTDYQRQALRQQIGYVSQDVIVFGGTLRENLSAALASGQLSDAQLHAACRKTGLAEVIAKLPQGLEHVLLEGGENLSMGERQLVALTRMMLRDPRILILDEATANIDERCERLIQSAVAELMVGRTSFIIAHRLSTIIQCDLILVFAGGEIVERGTHSELMARGGYYAELAGQQLS